MVWKPVFLCIFVGTFVAVQKWLPHPYMDEIFHIPQTMQYIVSRDFVTWDPKITTPPGLYYIGFLASFIVGSSVAALRSVNLIAIILTLATQPVEVASFPLLAFYSNLYYTDVWSTLLVLTALSRKNAADFTSALLFFVSLWFRQTSIIWLGLAAAFHVIDKSSIAGKDLKITQIFNYNVILGLIKRCYTTVSWAVYADILLFAGYIYVNGGITLGDKSNHQIGIHGAQILYFILFLSVFSAPLAVEWTLKKRGLLKRLYLVPIEVAVIAYIIKHGTIVHPFILADNRHYTFYIWRRFITPLGGNAIIPVYWAAYRWFASTLDLMSVRTWVYLAAVLAVLIPSPLMEPRYYIIPYLVWRCFIYKRKHSNLELAWYAIIEVGTVGLLTLTSTHFMW